jgi:hypothetical protein
MLPVAWAVMPSGLHRTYGVRHRDFITLFVLTQIAISQVPSGPTDSLPTDACRFRFVVGYVWKSHPTNFMRSALFLRALFS